MEQGIAFFLLSALSASSESSSGREVIPVSFVWKQQICQNEEWVSPIRELYRNANNLK
jgi:hypothetical protein